MKRMRQAAKVDDNQAPIVKALRKSGAYVCIIGQPYDLLVAWRGHWFVMEVKDPTKSPKHQELTPSQLDTLAKLRASAPLHLVRTPDEALCAIGARPWPEDAA